MVKLEIKSRIGLSPKPLVSPLNHDEQEDQLQNKKIPTEFLLLPLCRRQNNASAPPTTTKDSQVLILGTWDILPNVEKKDFVM